MRRWAAALALAAALSSHAQVPSWSLEAQRRLVAGASADMARDMAERQRLAGEGELALMRGDTEGAERAFDGAARMVHSPDIEMSLVRTYMQAGDYRRALTFASHTAGAHRSVPAGIALYVWLLQIGGQGAVARRFLNDALTASPDDAALLSVQAQLASPHPQPKGLLREPPLRVMPYAVPAALPAGTRVAGTALLLGDGDHALVPSATLGGSGRVWLRNGMGQTVRAEAGAAFGASSLTLLRLEAPLPALHGLPTSPRDPFAGSPCYTFEYSATAADDAAWPLLQQGFAGRWLAAPGDRLLGIDLPAGPRGGPVFDARGRLAGMALPGDDGRDRMLPWGFLAELVQKEAVAIPSFAEPASAALPPPGAGPANVALDELYEVAMRVTLQVLVGP